jgi:hypothetical protein
LQATVAQDKIFVTGIYFLLGEEYDAKYSIVGQFFK